jgi:hypothetical protein
MSGANFTLEGDENLKRMFSEFEQEAYRKPVIRCFKKAALPAKKAMIAAVPESLSPIKKIIRIKAFPKDMSLWVGAFKRQGVYVNKANQKWDPFQLAYWHNYGTMANRDPSHRFASPRRNKTSSRMGGIKPLRFIEKGWDQSQGQVLKIYEENIDKEVTKFFKDRALK